MDRKQIIKKLHKNGMTQRSIAKKFKLSHSRVWQIIHNYKSLRKPIPPIKHKILTKEKRKLLKYPTAFNIFSIKGGGRDYVREQVRIRDKHTCQKCLKKWEEGQRRFDIHHKDAKKEKTRQCDSYEKEKENMITLCHKCHMSLPESRKAISKGRKK